MYLAFPSFQHTPYHWTTIIPSHGFPHCAGKNFGTRAGTRVLCTQYLLRVTIGCGVDGDGGGVYEMVEDDV
jgi:hypothetical protein